MSDRDIEVSQVGWLNRLAGSFVALIIRLLLFVGSFVLLYWNEGRAVAAIDSLNAGASSVVSIFETAIDPAHQGYLVHVTATATVARAANDPAFHVSLDGALRLRRNVTMYQWDEDKKEETTKNLGGSETTTTTYTYKKVWSDRAIDSSKFKKPDDHTNPAMSFRTVTFDADTIKLGAFRLDKSLVDRMSGFRRLVPPDSADAAGVTPPFKRVGDQFYHGASPDTPAIGDMQVSYDVIEPQPVSVVAAQFGDTLAPFRGPDGRVIELVDLGTRDAGDMFQEAKSSAAQLTWILRGVGFLMMVIGLSMIAAPLAWLASVLPFLAGIVDAAAFAMALMIAIPLTLFTIAIAWLAHRPLIGAGLIVLGVVLAVLLHRLMPRRVAQRS